MDTEESRSRTQTICLVVLTAAVATYLIYWLRPVLVPLVVAVFVVSGVGPILKALEQRLGVTRLVAAMLTFLAGVVILVVFGCSLWVSVVDLSSNADAYRARVRELVKKVESVFPMDLSLKDDAKPTKSPAESSPPADDISSKAETGEDSPSLPDSDAEQETLLPRDSQVDSGGVQRSTETTAPIELPVAAAAGGSRHEKVTEFVDQFIGQGITVVSQTLINLVSTSVVVLIYVFFLLLGTPTDVNSSGTWRDVDHQIRSYLTLKTIISIFTGLVFGLSLRLFGVPMALTFGVLAFLLNFIPNVGPLVASLLPIPLIILDPSGSVGWMIAVITVTCAVQLISGNIVEPKIMGESADLHPVTILLALMFWGMMWGIVGMFLATPIMAGLKIVLERVDATRPIADIMAGRMPKEPILSS